MTDKMRVPFFDLRVTDKSLKNELTEAFTRVLDHGVLFLGHEVEDYEKLTQDYLGANYTLGVASGSSALYLALKSCGLKPGDEVITTPLTWIITANAIAACGAIPICVDVRDDFNIDPFKIENAITEKTKAIVPMHYSGLMCQMDLISEIASKHNLFIVEDAAQAFGATYKGKMSGTFSKIGAFSMNPMKPFAGYGESGLLVTEDKQLYDHLRILRHAGTKSTAGKTITNECVNISLNHKIDALQAALLKVVLKRFPNKIKYTNNIASVYESELSNYVKFQKTPHNSTHARYSLPVIAENVSKLCAFLEMNSIQFKVPIYPLINDCKIYKKYKRFETPIAEKLLRNTVFLPCHKDLSQEMLAKVIKCVRDFYS